MGGISYDLSNLDFPNSIRNLALGINDDGNVVGAYSLASLTSASFLYENGSYIPLNAPGDPNAYTQANAINNLGEIIGTFQTSVRAPPHGWIDLNGVISDHDVPGSDQTSLNGINDYGEIVGWYHGDIISQSSASSGVGPAGQYGFIEKNGQFYTFDVPSSYSTVLQGINDRNQLVGSYVDSTGGAHSFFYSDGALTQVAVPGAVKTTVGGLNNFDEIVGTYADQAGNTHGFIDDNGRYATFDVPNAGNSLSVSDVNDQGQIVGSYVDAAGSHGFVASPDYGQQHDGNTIQIVPVALGGSSLSFLMPGNSYQQNPAATLSTDDFLSLFRNGAGSLSAFGPSEPFTAAQGSGQQYFPGVTSGMAAFADLSGAGGHHLDNSLAFHGVS